MRNKSSLWEVSEKWPHFPRKPQKDWKRVGSNEEKQMQRRAQEQTHRPLRRTARVGFTTNKHVTIVKLLGMSMPRFSQRQNEPCEENELTYVAAMSITYLLLIMTLLPCLPEAATTFLPSAWECTEPQERKEIWSKFLQNPPKPRNRKNLSPGLARWFSR